VGLVTITIRPAAAADLPAVGEVHTRARNAAYEGIVPDGALRAVSPPAMGEWWTQRWAYEHGTHRLAVAQDAAGAVVGFTYVGPGPAAGTGEVYAIHVDPAHQRGGIGRALMTSALRTLGEIGESSAVLWVLAENRHARHFYERGGWLCDGLEREGPIGPVLTRQVRYARKLG
jgi:ribosomal protein S18 acetylase RimI-like enzyme